MLHDLLLALFGTTGGLIVDSGTNFMVNPKLVTSGMLNPAEVEMFNRIVILGWWYKKIAKFQSKYGGISTKLALQLAYNEEGAQGQGNESGNNQMEVASNRESFNGDHSDNGEYGSVEEVHGVYIKAFCQGVSEIITVYKEHLLAIEHEYLRDRSLTIPFVQQKLAVYTQMFPSLISLMDEIEEHGLKGGQLLDAISQRCVTGNPVIKSMFSKILYTCHRVFFHQINAWIVHG